MYFAINLGIVLVVTIILVWSCQQNEGIILVWRRRETDWSHHITIHDEGWELWILEVKYEVPIVNKHFVYDFFNSRKTFVCIADGLLVARCISFNSGYYLWVFNRICSFYSFELVYSTQLTFHYQVSVGRIKSRRGSWKSTKWT